jgi:hypothetical protein
MGTTAYNGDRFELKCNREFFKSLDSLGGEPEKSDEILRRVLFEACDDPLFRLVALRSVSA